MSRRLRYAGNVRTEDETSRPYGGLFDPVDDPNSPEFLPLEERGERSKARFWAVQSRKQDSRQSSAVVDG